VWATRAMSRLGPVDRRVDHSWVSNWLGAVALALALVIGSGMIATAALRLSSEISDLSRIPPPDERSLVVGHTHDGTGVGSGLVPFSS